MAATREQLIARWESEKGIQLARTIRQRLDQEEGTSVEILQSMLNDFPFVEEVAPQLDLRGLHLPPEDTDINEFFFIKKHDLSDVRFDYLRDVGNIVKCQMHGSIFDGMYNINGIFESDFKNASFVEATLQGTRFWYANVSGANFQRAHLGKADFTEVTCNGASFVEADMRFVTCTGADLRGVDLRGANLTGAGLGGITFDEQTQVQDTDLRGAHMDDAFRDFAQQAGAMLSAKDELHTQAYDLACIKALIALLQEKSYNADGHLDVVVPYLVEQRERLEKDAMWDWTEELGSELEQVVPQQTIDEIFDYLYPEAMRLLAYYL